MKGTRLLATAFVAFLFCFSAQAQELNFSVKINTQRLQTVDPRVFETLEKTIQDFLNNTKFTDHIYEPGERINCNLQLTIQQELSPTRFKADLAIQSSRPIFGSNYQTTMLNHQDRDVTFDYEQFQPLIFSRNAYNDNLSAVLSFYAYIILGLDYDSFSSLGGDPYFKIAQDILNNVPQGAAVANPGWRTLDGNRSRYWIIENMLSPRVRAMRQAMYDYHLHGLDVMYKEPAAGRAIILQALDEIGQVNQVYPNSMVVQMFNQTKGTEVTEIFKGGSFQEKDRVIGIMTRIDPSNAARYRTVRS
ncbi:MAG: DUF4835 family protein [Saprospiraceae bacterium]|nr:DUF4835 family protein [Saprospiraceae bacterium]